MRAVFVMIKADPAHLQSVADAVAELESYSEMYSIAGAYDLLVKLYVESFDEVPEIVTEKIRTIPHVRETETILTFRAYKLPDRGPTERK